MLKKLLFITPVLPYPFDMATKVRMFNLIKSLSERFNITLTCQIFSRDEFINVEVFKKYCRHINVIVADNKKSRVHRFIYMIKYWFYFIFKNIPQDLFYSNYCGLQKNVRTLLKNDQYDVCFFAYWFWPELLSEASGLKVVDTNDVQYQRLEQLGEFNGYFKRLNKKLMNDYRRQEIETLQKFDVVIAITEKDNETLGKFIDKDKIVTVPTGLDTDYYTPMNGYQTSEKLISFYGAMGGKANVEALLYFYRDIFPLIKKEVHDAKLIIVGANPTQDVLNLSKQDKDVTVTGYVKDVREYLGKSKVSVCPMRVGYGIRGRVLELMSMGIPVVVTEIAVDGMGLQEGQGVVMRNNPADFARAVIDFLRDTSLRKKIGLSGRNFVRENYSYASTYDHLTKLIFNAAALHIK